MSPAGAIPAHTIAGQYPIEVADTRFNLNTYASCRGNTK